MVRVKFISRINVDEWRRYFPQEDGIWKGCQFLFDRQEENYDWLVVYDDLAPMPGQTPGEASEPLRCKKENTLLITTEPSSIKSYGRSYVGQFGHVLTTQPFWALPHPRRHWQHTANHWYYGGSATAPMAREKLLRGPSGKTALISIMGSPKAQKHTLHAQRFAFTQRIQELLPEIDVLGKGFRLVADKAEALDPYKYHIALENHVSPHHMTEKLPDAFLGRCLPFYAGAPNATDYFPEGSFVAIDINDPEQAAVLVRKAIAESWYEDRLPLINEARRRVIEEHHVFAVIAGIIQDAGAAVSQGDDRGSGTIYSRHALRRSSAGVAVLQVLEKLYARVRTFLEKIL